MINNNRLYLGDAFGWDTESTAKVAISQLRSENTIRTEECPCAQLIKNASFRWLPNGLKILGYIPIVNVFAGIVAFRNSEGFSGSGPNHMIRWKIRGAAMIVGGPLLLAVDLIKHLFNLRIVNNYNREHADLIQAFNTNHRHSPSFWPGHPIHCE